MTDWSQLRAPWAGRWMQFMPVEAYPKPPAPLCYVVVLILNEQGQFLLANIRDRGYCVPSGRIEPGEAPEQSARREAYEEAGAVLQELQLIGWYLLEPCSPKEPEPCASPVYLAHAEQVGLPEMPAESLGTHWATLDELPTLYYDWSPLLEAVFRYAWERSRTHGER
ncbi:MAG: NUDIX hydrolase [Fimbriimonadales bacterium]